MVKKSPDKIALTTASQKSSAASRQMKFSSPSSFLIRLNYAVSASALPAGFLRSPTSSYPHRSHCQIGNEPSGFACLVNRAV